MFGFWGKGKKEEKNNFKGKEDKEIQKIDYKNRNQNELEKNKRDEERKKREEARKKKDEERKKIK